MSYKLSDTSRFGECNFYDVKKTCLATKRLQSEKMQTSDYYVRSTMKNTKRFYKPKTNGISDMHENTEKNQCVASINFFITSES